MKWADCMPGIAMANYIVPMLAAFACAMPLAAQEYPVKPVRILVGFAPGGGIDISDGRTSDDTHPDQARP